MLCVWEDGCHVILLGITVDLLSLLVSFHANSRKIYPEGNSGIVAFVFNIKISIVYSALELKAGRLWVTFSNIKTVIVILKQE